VISRRAKRLAIRAWGLTALLATTAAGVASMQPAKPTAANDAALRLDRMIPAHFSGWRALPRISPLVVDPRVTSQVEQTYSETVERVYRGQGDRMVMLSVAYGTHQLHDGLQAHRPEYCYRAQGFTVEHLLDTSLQTDAGPLKVRRLLTRRAARLEPVTYWMMVDRRAVLPGFGRQLAQLAHGLRGQIPDGLLVRVSSLDMTPDEAWPLHERFLTDLFSALQPADMERLTGLQWDSVED
jgi:EpsI family protein